MSKMIPAQPLIEVAAAAFDAFELANAAIQRQVKADEAGQPADLEQAGAMFGRRLLAAELLFTLTGFRPLTDGGRADVILSLAALGVPKAQAILDAEFGRTGTSRGHSPRRTLVARCVGCGTLRLTELVHQHGVGEVRMCERCYSAARQDGGVD